MKEENRSKALTISLLVLFILAGWLLSSKMGDIKGALAGVYDSSLSFFKTADQDDLFPPESLVEVSDLNFKEQEKNLEEEDQEETVFVLNSREEQEAEEIETEKDDNLSSKENRINQMKDKIVALRRQIGEMRSELGQIQSEVNRLQNKIEQLK